MSSVIPFIIWIFCVGVAALIIGKVLGDGFSDLDSTQTTSKTTKTEGFTGTSSSVGGGISVTTCPSGSVSYVTEAGNTYCCNGDIVDGQCNGNNVCSLSPNPPDKTVETCSAWLVKEWKRRSDRFCPLSIPNYFGKMNRGQGINEGCSVSTCTSDGSEPYDPTRKQCKIYNTREEELSNVDSCYNVMAMENLVCPQSNATKSIVLYPISGKAMPAILKCNYMPSSGKSNGMPVDCMDADSVMAYLEARDPGSSRAYTSWINTCVAFCGASKDYYVDGTLPADKAQCVTTMGGSPTCPTCPKREACPECPTCPSSGAAASNSPAD